MLRVLTQFPVLGKQSFLGWLSKAAKRRFGTRARFSLRTENWHLRTTLRLACVLAAVASFAPAQQIDLAGGASTLWSPGPLTASQAFLPPAESGGLYANASLQYIGEKRLGLNVEGAFRAKEGLYNGYQYYRPILYDVNAVYARRMATKIRGDFMAGVGGETLVFYKQTNCNYSSGCSTNVNNTHFLLHAGVGVRYYVWRTLFVRPEAHYYYIPNNFEFHSDHVFRIGASIGHTFGSK
jgi:hypothetical protein